MAKNERKEIFDQIKKLLKKYEPPFIARSDFESRFELWSEKEFVIAERKLKEVYSAGLIIQSTYVSFYFMPVYADTILIDLFEQELLSTLKGKSCFHIKNFYHK